MIDGLYPSQFVQVENLHTSHYRNLKNIVNKHALNISFPSPRFIEISKKKKLNHENWRSFNELQQEEKKFRKNATIFEKLQRISTNSSPYRYQNSKSSPDALLHHNYFCQNIKRISTIERDNRLLASRIINTKGIINNKKLFADYKLNKLNVSRMQKFQRFKRMSRVVNRSLQKKFGQSFKITKNSFNSFNSIKNPQSI